MLYKVMWSYGCDEWEHFERVIKLSIILLMFGSLSFAKPMFLEGEGVWFEFK